MLLSWFSGAPYTDRCVYPGFLVSCLTFIFNREDGAGMLFRNVGLSQLHGITTQNIALINVRTTLNLYRTAWSPYDVLWEEIMLKVIHPNLIVQHVPEVSATAQNPNFCPSCTLPMFFGRFTRYQLVIQLSDVVPVTTRNTSDNITPVGGCAASRDWEQCTLCCCLVTK
jgi:hypothetical protein